MRPYAVLLLITACGTRLTGIASELSVSERVDFAATALGDTRIQPLALTNLSRAPLSLHLSAPKPFATELDVRLGGGESRTVELAFVPEQLGAAAVTLQLAGDVATQVALHGEGITAASCAGAPCRLSRRDPATNACIEENAADGTSCASANACLAGGQCLAGACVGTPLSCDDSNRCTVDACEPVGGCVHFATTCPEPADKCQVALCDPATGCATAPAPDGTRCGPRDCTTAHVCMAGACKPLPVPDGFACGDESPCRAKGRCFGGACSQAPATALVESWSRPMPYDVAFHGVTDSAGNLVWVECQAVRRLNPCELVSTTPAGLERFRVTVGVLSAPGSVRQLASGGRIFVGGPGGALAAYSETTGALAWQISGSGGGDALLAMAADRHGLLQLTMHFVGESEAWSLATLDATTGVTLRAKGLFGRPSAPVLDAQDNVYLEVSGTQWPLGRPDGGAVPGVPVGAAAEQNLLSFTPGGALRFAEATDHTDAPVAAFNGDLLLASGEVRSTLDGSLKPSARHTGTWRPLAPLLSATARFRWNDSGCCPTCDCDAIGFTELEGWAAAATSPRFTWGVFNSFDPVTTELTLLKDGTALFASPKYPSNDVYLRALDGSGAEQFSCLVGSGFSGSDPVRWQGATALTAGRWAVVEQVHCTNCLHDPPPTLRVYSTPGLELATSGWTGPGGTPGRTGAPR